MAKNRKVLLTVLSVALIAIIGIFGTIAYLTDTDSQANVMTMGNVDIEQHEFERVVGANGEYTTITVDGVTSYELQEFTQAKPLLPYVGEVNNGYDPTEVRLGQLGHNSRGGMSVFPAENVVDKFVVVENTGRSDAYVRTLVAFEAGSLTEEEWCKIINYSSHFTWKETQDWFVTNIDGNNYYMVEFVYNGYKDIQHPNGVVPAGDYTYNSLAQVYMFDTATNDDIIALDGNNNGTYDILVLSQAVQADGFADAKTALDTAFGTFNEENVKTWFGGTELPATVDTAEELSAALAAGGEVILDANVTLNNEAVTVPAGVTAALDLNGKTLTVKNTEAKASAAINNKGNLTITNGTVTYEGIGDTSFGYGTNTINNSGKLVIDGATIVNTTATGSSVAIDNAANGELIVNSGEITSMKNAIRLCPFGSGAINCTINGGTIAGARAIQIQLPSNKPADAPVINLTVNGGTLKGSSDISIYSYSAGQSFANVTVALNGGTFENDVLFGGGTNKETQETVIVTGGNFLGELGRYLAGDGWADIAKP
ncbi:MAG: hypothetical protein IIY02_04855 [Firmicutes bacterium]|nr:hypothetical protein [Bacillota bacterium]